VTGAQFALTCCAATTDHTQGPGGVRCSKERTVKIVKLFLLVVCALALASSALAQSRGFWIQGLQPTEFINTPFIDIEGASGQITAKGVNRYDNGDKTYSRSTGISDLKASTSSGKWTYTGGTGKLNGIKGGGTYTCKMKSAEVGAGYTCEVAGEYTLPAAKK
jgi:hypothetical protein